MSPHRLHLTYIIANNPSNPGVFRYGVNCRWTYDEGGNNEGLRQHDHEGAHRGRHRAGQEAGLRDLSAAHRRLSSGQQPSLHRPPEVISLVIR